MRVNPILVLILLAWVGLAAAACIAGIVLATKGHVGQACGSFTISVALWVSLIDLFD